MNTQRTIDREKIRKDRAKKAIALAMENRWEDAIAVNQSVIKDFPEDLETFNRLGKAFSELGRNAEAVEAFEKALALSPHNSIARKNLDRLARLGDAEGSAPALATGARAVPRVFIEESGKSGVMSLLNLAAPQVLVKLAPGHVVQLEIENNKLSVMNAAGDAV
ncbi:MAG: tetratricopeptide repeat protein, partial [Chloroflexi bacterium]|nr:tetratricopeptide repeat protein [Chloroflexota bacterium]